MVGCSYTTGMKGMVPFAPVLHTHDSNQMTKGLPSLFELHLGKHWGKLLAAGISDHLQNMQLKIYELELI